MCLGGGTGLSTILRGLKRVASVTAVVTTTDDGGSSGRLRRDFDMPAPGDLRSCLAALAEDESLVGQLFQHRFTTGELAGHSFGNLFLAGMTDLLGSFDEAVSASARVLAVAGQVVPSTVELVELVARFPDGHEVRGESALAADGAQCERVRLDPPVARRPSSGAPGARAGRADRDGAGEPLHQHHPAAPDPGPRRGGACGDGAARLRLQPAPAARRDRGVHGVRPRRAPVRPRRRGAGGRRRRQPQPRPVRDARRRRSRRPAAAGRAGRRRAPGGGVAARPGPARARARAPGPAAPASRRERRRSQSASAASWSSGRRDGRAAGGRSSPGSSGTPGRSR